MPDSESEDEYIGTAWITEDGTIEMKLRAVGPGIYGVGKLSYPKTHPNYAEIQQHLGPMKPGEEVLVRPFPD